MTSKFSIDNKELLQRISSGEAVVGIDFGNLIVRELAAFRLSAMDSEPVELPLDYLQGHKDGLEWAARLAEANHPETGDWLYDDPIELAKAIRKGPDMQPAQPVADSEPDRNPVLAYADSYRDMAKQGVESVPIWSVITDLERNIAPLYRHALPAPVVQCPFPCGWDNLNKLAIQDAELVARGLVEGELTTEAHRQAAISNNDRLLKVISSCRAAMLHAGNSPAQNSVAPAKSPIDHGYRPECECSGCKATARICSELSANSPASPSCWCRTCRPVVLNDMRFVVCPDCGNKRCPRANDHRNACTGSNEPGQEGNAYPDTPREVKP